MKNIHVLPTGETIAGIKTKNIYITSDEEIKEGDWIYDAFDKTTIYKATDVVVHNIKSLQYPYCKKIILTTDQDLIKYGVQAIDDNFIEWFVKNPSCEYVKTEIVEFGFDEVPICTYEIIIPKEEDFKHELHVMSKEEVIANRSNAYEFIDFDKQETLEEAAEKYTEFWLQNKGLLIADAFNAGAKWQQERMYSEEEVMDMFHNLSMHLPLHYEFLVKEQFKNK